MKNILIRAFFFWVIAHISCFNFTSGWTRHFPNDAVTSLPSSSLPSHGVLGVYSPTNRPGTRIYSTLWDIPYRLLLGFGSSPELESSFVDPFISTFPEEPDDAHVLGAQFDDLWEFSFDHKMFRFLSGSVGEGTLFGMSANGVPLSEFSVDHRLPVRSASVGWIGSPFDSGGSGTIMVFGGSQSNLTYSAQPISRFSPFYDEDGDNMIYHSTYFMTPLNDLWEFSVETYEWRQLFSQDPPVPHWDEDDIDRWDSPRFDIQFPEYYDDVVLGEYDSALQPVPVANPCVAVSKGRPDEVFVFGGQFRQSVMYDLPYSKGIGRSIATHTLLVNSLWQFSVTELKWRMLNLGFCPVDEPRKGLHPDRGFCDDISALAHPMANVSVGNFSEMVTPTVRSETSCWAYDDMFVIYGGDFMSDMFAFNSTLMMWAKLNERNNEQPTYFEDADAFHANNTPSSRFGAVAWTHEPEAGFRGTESGSEGILLVLFGGMTYFDESEFGRPGHDPRLWIYSVELNMWKVRNVSNGGSTDLHERFQVASVSGRRRMMLYGGLSLTSGSRYDEVWSLDMFNPFCGEHAVFDNSSGTPFCNCSAGYGGVLCDEFECFGVDTKSEDACFGRGICAVPGVCSCLPQAHGDRCQYHNCYAEDARNVGAVCGGNGDCRDRDICDCWDGFYGIECQEKIAPIGYYVFDQRLITIEYAFEDSPSILQRFYGSCDQVILNSEILGVRKSCRFDTHSLIVTLGAEEEGPSNGDILMLRPLTNDVDDDSFVEVVIQLVETPPFTLPGGVIAGIIIGVLVGILLLLVVGVIVVVVAISGTKLARQKKLMKGFELESQTLLSSRSRKITFKDLCDSTLEIPYGELQVEEVVGKGGSNSVIFRVSYAGQDCAFKCFRLSDLDGDDDLAEFEKECSVLASVKHPHILRFYGVTLQKNRIGIVMEFCANGSLQDFFLTHRGTKSFNEKIRMLMEISSGLAYLHGRSIVHRDVKGENVLLDDALHCKLIDFGVSKVFEREGSGRHTQRVGTSVYMAPEVVSGTSYTSAVDIYSFGIMAFEILTECFKPYGDENTTFNIEYRVALDPNFRPDTAMLVRVLGDQTEQRWIIPIVRLCWAHDPDLRPNSTELFATLQRRSGIEGVVAPASGVKRRARLSGRRHRRDGENRDSILSAASELGELLNEEIRVMQEQEEEEEESEGGMTSEEEEEERTTGEAEESFSEGSSPFGDEEEEEDS